MSEVNIDLGSIVEIEAIRDLYKKTGDGNDVRMFSRGNRYKVLGWLRDLWVADGTGTDNLVGGEYLTANFLLHRKANQ